MLLSFVFAGSTGLIGMAVGLAGTTFNTWALWGAIRLLGKAHGRKDPGRFGAFFIVLAFLVKLPVIVLLGMMMQRLGGAAPSCFLVGLLLVYSALIGWAMAQS